MNSIGRLFRVSVVGESHGPQVSVVIDGCPAGISLAVDDFMPDLERRQGRGVVGTTPRKEDDVPIFLSGYFNGMTTGAPLLISFQNTNIRSVDYEKLKDTPRPGHADYVAYKKFGGFNDYRGGGHFSGRLTVALVAAGVVAKKVLQRRKSDISIEARLLSVGGSKDISATVEAAIADGDSVGGVVECVMRNLPIGLGDPFFDSFESLLAHAIFSVPAVKGVEFGGGFAAASMRGSEFNDVILGIDGSTSSNHNGGINGGITNGNDVVVRVAVKPTSSIKKEQSTINLKTGSVTSLSVAGRHDACIALRIPVVIEAVAAIVTADQLVRGY